ncbi:MAG: helix-turn-helix transcriptional regulator [Patescibacteria group bacterium]
MTSGEYDRTHKALGETFRQAREKAGLKQQDVADKANMHVNYYARIERGQENPSFEKLQSIMRVLKIKSLDLF